MWIDDERSGWKGADTEPAVLLNTRCGWLGVRGARDIIAAIAGEANLPDEFTSHVLRHSFGTMMIRDGRDIVVVAELMGHARLDTTAPTPCPPTTTAKPPSTPSPATADQRHYWPTAPFRSSPVAPA